MTASVHLAAGLTAATAGVMVALLLAVVAADGPSPVAAGAVLVLLASARETVAALRAVVREARACGGAR